MTSTIDTADASEGLVTREGVVGDPPTPTRKDKKFGIRSRPVTRTVRGRRTVVVPSERLSPADLAQRVPFVVVVLMLIGAGVGGTLLLSAQTTQDTYDLKNARDANVELVERMESLQASNERARSAEILATRAAELGMVGVASAPILTRGSDGLLEVVGEPEAKLGAPIKPLQPPPVASGSSRSSDRDGFAAPPAPLPQDRTPRGVAPVPYPAPVGPPPAAVAAPPSVVAPAPEQNVAPPAENRPEAPAPEQAAPVPEPTLAGNDLATLAPVPGQMH